MKKQKFGNSEKLYSTKEISGIGLTATVKILRGKTVRFINLIGRSLAYTSTRSYGAFLLSFGLLSLLLNLGEYYFMEEPQMSPGILVISFALIVVAIPLLFFDKSMCVALQDFPPTDYLLFEFFSIKSMHKKADAPTVPPLIAMFIGFIPAVIGFFLPLGWVIITLALCVAAAVAFTSPEFPMILTLLSLPYLSLLPYSTVILCSLSLLTFLSYLVKVVLGKRVLHLGVFEVLIPILMLVVFISGAVGYGSESLKGALVVIALMFAYFPARNMIVNKRLADCAVNAIIISAVPITVLAVIEFIVEFPKSSFKPPIGSTEGTSVFFSSPEALAAFMLVAAIMTLTFAVEKKRIGKKLFYLITFILEISVLGLVMRPEAWLTVLLCAMAYPIVRSRKIPLDLLVIIVAIPHLLLLLPLGFLDTVSGLFGMPLSFSEKISGYREAFSAFAGNVWIGIGFGDGSYILATGGDGGGIFNTLLAVAAKSGVIALSLLLVILLLKFHSLSYYRAYTRPNIMGPVADMAAIALVALLTFGAFDNVFADRSVLYLFCTVFAISGAAGNVAKRDYDDRFGYYGDLRSAESSALDIGLSK